MPAAAERRQPERRLTESRKGPMVSLRTSLPASGVNQRDRRYAARILLSSCL
jgi:hypothetical protein